MGTPWGAWRSALLLLTGGLVCALVVAAVLLFTSTVDRESKALGVKRERDTRLMLVHEMRRRWVCEPDGLVVGSSRTRVLGHAVVDGVRFYSITANGMALREYAGYIDAWVERCGKRPKIILLGLDFFGSGVDPMFPAPPPEEYLTRLGTIAQRLGFFELLSTSRVLEGIDILLDEDRRPVLVDALQAALPAFLAPTLGAPEDEEEGGTEGADADEAGEDEADGGEEDGVTDEEDDASSPFELDRYRTIEPRDIPRRVVAGACAVPRLERVGGSRVALAQVPGRFSHSRIYEERYRVYRLDPKFVGHLQDLRRRYSDARIVAFVTPTTHVLFGLLVDLGRLPDYEAFLAASIEALGEVWEFGGLNSVTAARSNFTDENHLRPRAADVMAAVALGMAPETASVAPADFGIRLDASNLDEYVAGLRERVERPRVPRSRRSAKFTSSIAYEVISARRTAKHERRGDCGVMFGRNGIEIDVSGAPKTKRLELGLNASVEYRVEYRDLDDRVLAKSTVPADPDFGAGARSVRLEIPKRARGDKLATIKIVAKRSRASSRYLGHLRFR